MKAKVRRRYQQTLDGYLRWISPSMGVLFRPTFLLDTTAPDALEAMFNWESLGVVPISSSEPELLAEYVQAKRSRDWHITEWRLVIKDGLFRWWEFVGTFGLTAEECQSILI